MSIRIALAGNPNSGKTTLFNALTGANQFVGNWPGVTVEKKEGKLKANKDVTIIDLPGIYSLSPYTLEEVISRNFLIEERPDAILNIVDGTNLERNLFLTTQLSELGIPVVAAVNMMDVVRKTQDEINTANLAKALGCRVVEISALKAEGIDEAVTAAVEAAEAGTNVPSHNFSGSVEHALAHIEEHALHDLPEEQQRWYAIKLFERDKKIIDKLGIEKSRIEHIEKDILECEREMEDDSESIITTERYNYIDSVIDKCRKVKNKGGMTISDKIDSVVTNRFAALPIFALVMVIVYAVSVTTLGAWLTDWANDGVFGEGWILFGMEIPGIPVLIRSFLDFVRCADWLQALIMDGIVAGVGAVLGFVPQILLLFLFLAFLEACGYMARIAFILDRVFRKFGLSGKSFIPILIGTGCGVPGIMAARTIENERDRRMTVITTTFIPCAAKLPIVALISGALFGGAWWVAPSAYFVGIAAIICSGIILKKMRLFAGEAAPFVMELPAYHRPAVSALLKSMWDRGWSFIKKAGTIIMLGTVVIWFASNFGWENGSFGMVDMDNSILASVGSVFAWVFSPLGWGDWKTAVAALTGIVAKENIVGTFGILYGHSGIAENGNELWSQLAASLSALAAYSFLIFNLLCAPCLAAIGAIRREMNNPKWFWFAIGYQCVFAYIVSFCVYQIGMLAGGAAFGISAAAALLLAILFVWVLFRRPAHTR